MAVQKPESPEIMDCEEEFLIRFGGKAFSTFDAFSKELQAFEESTGTQYMMKRTCLFNEGTLGREFLVYRYMHYACVRHIPPAKKMGQRAGGTKCSAYFSVGTRRHKLFVRQYDMHHNHSSCMAPIVEDPPSPVVDDKLEDALNENALSQVTVKDCTEEFLKIFQSMSFASFDDLQAKMDKFQIITGSRYVKTNTRRLPPGSPASDTLVYSHLVYICYRYGTNISEAKNRKQQRTAKIGCLSKIYFYSQDNYLHVRRYDFRHNHEVRPDLVQFPPKRRRPRKAIQEEQEKQLKMQQEEEKRQQQHLQQEVRQQRHHHSQPVPIHVFEEIDEDIVDDELDEEEEEDDEQGPEMMLYHQIHQPPHSLPSQVQFENDIRSVFPMHDFNNLYRPYPPSQAENDMHHQVPASSPYPSFTQSGPRNLSQHHLRQLKYEEEEQAEAEEMQEFDVLYQPDPNWVMMRSMQKHSRPLDAMLPRLGPHIQRLTELATCCGPVRFSTRVRELKALGDKWCRENEILMKRRGLI